MAIPQPIPVVEIQTNATDAVHLRTKVDADGVRQLIHHVVHQYADPKIGITREYVSNAVDASRADDAPVLVTTPTALSPMLVIADGGTGMTLRELEDHMLAFGASTKRDSNEDIGALGLGAKSAWMVSPTFQVETVKDGLLNRVTVAASLEHQMSATDVPTNRPNGTVVSIPVDKDFEQWHAAALDVAAGHRPGRVHVNGEHVTSMYEDAAWAGPVAFFKANTPRRSMRVVSGGAQFDVPWSLSSAFLRETGITGTAAPLVELGIGSFAHTPSRDSVLDDSAGRTKAALAAAAHEFKSVIGRVQGEVSQLASVDLAAALALRSSVVGDSLATRSLIKIPHVSKGGSARVLRCTEGTRGGRRWEALNFADVQVGACEVGSWRNSAVVVAGVPASRSARAVSAFLKESAPKAKTAILLESPGDAFTLHFPGLDGGKAQELAVDLSDVPVFDYADVKQFNADRRPATTGRSGTRDLRYEVQQIVGGKVQAQPMMSRREIAAQAVPVFLSRLGVAHRDAAVMGDCVVVILGDRKPEAVGAGTFGVCQAVREGRNRWLANASAVQIDALALARLGCMTRKRVEALAGVAPCVRLSHPLRDKFALAARVNAAASVCVPSGLGYASHRGVQRIVATLAAAVEAVQNAYPLICKAEDYAPAALYINHTPPMA